MVWPRYVVYFLAVTAVTWLITKLEIVFPGFLRFYVGAYEGDPLGTSEFSPIEIMQPFILAVCGGLLAWVAQYCPSQRPIAFPFGGLALAFLIRECDYFLDRYVVENLWQSLIVVSLAFVIAYTYRARKRLRIAWARIWPSPGLAMWFAGAVILFSFVRFVGNEPLWMSILGDGYQRVVELAVEEFIELAGYFLWLIGTVEYTYQARGIAYRKPQPAARRRREKRRHDRERPY
jgi:hypothetical protein